MIRQAIMLVFLWMSKVLIEAYYHFTPNDAILRLSAPPEPVLETSQCPYCRKEIMAGDLAARSKTGAPIHTYCAARWIEKLHLIRGSVIVAILVAIVGLGFAATAWSNAQSYSRVDTDQAQQAIIWWLAHSPENKTLPPATVTLWGPLKKKPKWGYTMEVTYKREGAGPETILFDLDQDFRRVRAVRE